MTTLNEAVESMYSHFKTGWATKSDTLVLKEDEKKREPSDPAITWLRMSYVNTSRFQDSLGTAGNRRFFNTGIFLVQIFSPKNRGVAQSQLLFQDAQDIMEGVTLSAGDVRLLQTEPQAGGKESKWVSIVAETGVEFDEIR